MTHSTTPEILARFDALCSAVQERGKGITLHQLGDCHALARELEADSPDRERVEDLAARLELDPEELS